METSSDSSIDWEEVIVRMESFTRSLLKKQKWFRGGSVDFFLKGKEMKDYVYGAIEQYLRNPEKYDSSKGDLVSYLNWSLVRTLVSNDATSKENKTSRDVFAYEGSTKKDGEELPYLDRILPAIEPMFSDKLDYNQIKTYIEDKLEGDKVMEEIFLGTYSYGMKRRDIIDEFGMSASEYDNGNRRLATIIRQATAIFNPNSATV